MNKTKFLAGLSTVSLVLSAALPVGAAISADASNTGNGAGSYNKSKISVSTNTSVSQFNYADVDNSVVIKANTGGNKANANTGGDVSIETGNAGVGVSLSTAVNANSANLDACGGCDYDLSATNDSNGADTHNKAKIGVESSTDVMQDNEAIIENKVGSWKHPLEVNTGDNKANRNTGPQDAEVSIETGTAAVEVGINNAANSNELSLGGGSMDLSLGVGLNGDGAAVSVSNTGNGAGSYNKAKAEIETSLSASQFNYADIENKVKAKINTGGNKTNANTGGDVSTETGDAGLGVGIKNDANANLAALDSACCDLDVAAANEKNGADSYNKTKVKYDSGSEIVQLNDAGYETDGIENKVMGEIDTGSNKANRNTADPSVETGLIDAAVVVETQANTNILGTQSFNWFDWDDFEWDGGWNGDEGSFGFWGWFFWLWLMR